MSRECTQPKKSRGDGGGGGLFLLPPCRWQAPLEPPPIKGDSQYLANLPKVTNIPRQGGPKAVGNLQPPP